MTEALHVLIIEDVESDAILIVETLKHGGFNVDYTVIESEQELKTNLEKKRWDIVLSDFSLPRFTGMQALELIKKYDQDLPFVLITGALGEEKAVAAMKAGAKDFFLKGHLARLPNAVSRILEDVVNAKERKRAESEKENLLKREKLARAEAERLNRVKDEFLATLSHELRTPMNAITGWADLLRRGELDTENTKKAHEVIYRNALNQNRLIEDLLSISSIIRGKFHIEARPVELLPITRAAIDAVKPSADARNITLKLSVDPLIGPVSGDPSRLQQIIWNLLTNAIKFTPAGGRVEVQLRQKNFLLEISVTDTGIGIDNEFLPYVFDRFRQEEAGLKRHYGGLGLGLAIVRHLTELHGGTITASSEGKGLGSKFTLQLPLLKMGNSQNQIWNHLAANKEAKENQPITDRLQGLKILVVDDQPDVVELLEFFLERQGALTHKTLSAEEALKQMTQQNFDLIISDIEMPEIDGYEFVRRVRAKNPYLPLIALTAHVRDQDRRLALSAGFNEHLGKPIDTHQLIQCVLSLTKNKPPPHSKISEIQPL